MENGWNLFNFSSSSSSSFGRVHNSRNNCTTTAAWDISESGTATTTTSSRLDWSGNGIIINSHDSFPSPAASTHTTATATANQEKPAAALKLQSLMVAHEGNRHQLHHYPNSSSDHPSRLYYTPGTGTRAEGSNNYLPDPHLMCLKLGKRHYFGDANIAATPQLGDHQPGAIPHYSMTKKGKPYYDVAAGVDFGFVDDDDQALMSSVGVGVTLASSSTGVPRCQVDGCNAVLLNVKDYHRRHKVCESHSKAPKVLVLGMEQRFCQQCSRFHAVSEFDESKRSCRRRLAGHNERRRKSSQEHSGIRNQTQVNSRLMMSYPGRHEYMPLNTGCALSLLSSKNESWVSATDLPARCSAALRELIAENRAAILSRQLILDKDWWHWQYYCHHPAAADQDMNFINIRQQNVESSILNPATAASNNCWESMSGEEANAHVTLDLMQMQPPNSAFGFLPTLRGKSKVDDEDCPELWSTSFGGEAHVL